MWPNPQKTAVWSHSLKKSLMENFIYCAVTFNTFKKIFKGVEILYKVLVNSESLWPLNLAKTGLMNYIFHKRTIKAVFDPPSPASPNLNVILGSNSQKEEDISMEFGKELFRSILYLCAKNKASNFQQYFLMLLILYQRRKTITYSLEMQHFSKEQFLGKM